MISEYVCNVVEWLIAIMPLIMAIIALITLYEMKKGRESSYQPNIVVDERPFYIYFPEKKLNFKKKYSYSNQKPINDTDLDIPPGLKLKLFNIGLASAKNIEIKFSFEVDKMLDIVRTYSNEFPPNRKIEVDIIKKQETHKFLFKNSESKQSNYSQIDSELKQSINHILPIKSIENDFPNMIQVPQFITDIHSTLICNLVNNDVRGFPNLNLPPITLNIKYKDIGNKSYSKVISVHLKYITFASQKVEGYIETEEL